MTVMTLVEFGLPEQPEPTHDLGRLLGAYE